MYKEINNICFQLDYGDIFKVWFLNVCKKGDEQKLNKHIIKEKFKTKADGLKRFNEVIKVYTEDNFKCFVCGSERTQEEIKRDGFNCVCEVV